MPLGFKIATLNSRENSQNWTPLLTAAREGKTRELARLLAASSEAAQINARTVEGKTPLMYAAEHGHQEVRLQIAPSPDLSANACL